MNMAASNTRPLEKYHTSLETRLRRAEEMPLARIAAKLRERFGTLNAPSVHEDRLMSAIQQVRRGPSGLRPGQRLLLAFALSQLTVGLGGKSLVEDRSILEPVLRDWERDARRGTMRLSHWKGLFHSYMQVEAGQTQQRLAKLLKGSLESAVASRRHPPPWLDGFHRHTHLLGNDPCAPYVAELMTGRVDQLQDLRDRAGVSIPPASWFWQRLKAEVLHRICRMGNKAFAESLAMFIGLDKILPLATDDLVKTLLERYGACDAHPKHPELMEFALGAWQSPQLDSNLGWKNCSKATREMVCRWIAKEDLEQFYRLCKGDNAVDEARLEFWLGFQKQMTYTQILLGSDMRKSTDAGIRKFVEERTQQGRLGHLLGGTTNNAMLMQIGGWVFVEFSQIGTACRAIRLPAEEFETGQHDYELGSLRHTGEKWIHTNASWQPKFLGMLDDKNIRPDDQPAAKTRVRAPNSTNPSNRSRNDNDLSALASMGLVVRDHRDAGGALWAFPTERTTGAMLSELARMGFRYASAKRAWYRS